MKTKTTLAIFFAVLLVISVLAAAPVLSFGEASTEIILIETKGYNTIAYMETQGARIIETYDGHALVEIDSSEIARMEKMGLYINRMEHRTKLHVQGYEYDLSQGEPNVPEELRIGSYDSGVTGQYIVQMLGPVVSSWRNTLEQMDVEVMSYMHNYAYRVRMTPETAKRVDNLDFVGEVVIYQPYFKIQPGLNPGLVEISIVSGADQGSISDVFETVDVIYYTELPGGELLIRASVRSTVELHSIAMNKDVAHVLEYVAPVLLDEMATQLIGGGLWFYDDEDDNPTTAYRLHGDYGSYMNQIGYKGEGFVIAIADSGLGGGTISDQHPDFQDRVIGGYSYQGGWEDGHGHGTHCAGSIAGNTHAGTGTTVYNNYYAGQGSAPAAELYGIRNFDSAGNPIGPLDIYHMVQIAKENADAYVHSNSWGADVGGRYNADSSRYDAAVRGEEVVVVVASGNAGSGLNTVGSPATGKNVIAVGATRNYNPGAGYNNPEAMAGFSSRGYTMDNRVKPDVVAPGDYIRSTGITSGYNYRSGTSMATPAVAGAAAIVGEWYETNHMDGVRPSPAMVRALMINTAEPLGTIPNEAEGWGIVDISKLQRPLSDPVPFYLYDQGHVFENSLEVDEHLIMPDRLDEPLKINLAWTDKEAGGVGDGRTLINDLNLEVESPTGLIYRGNAFSGGWTPAGADAMAVFDHDGDGWDDANNIENVYIHPDDVEDGVYTVRVIANNIADDAVGLGYNSQDFALAVYNAMTQLPGDPPSVTVVSPSGGESWTARTQQDIEWTATGGDDDVDYINLAYSVDNGENWVSIASNLPNTGTHTWTLPNEHSSDSLIRVRAVDEARRMGEGTSDATFQIVGVAPEPPQNVVVEHYGEALNILIDDDVESGDLGYTTGQDSGASDWAIRDLGAYSPTHSWDFGDGQFNKNPGMLSWLISPEIDIPADADEEYGAYFTFQHWYEWGDTSMYDGGNVKISNDGVDGPWTLITPEEGYTGTISGSYDNPLGGQQGWGGSSGWTQATFDLRSYIGETVHIRWDAGVEAWSGFYGTGWRVDDIYMDVELDDVDGTNHNLITWLPSPDEELGEVSHYDIFRSEDQSGPWGESALLDSVDAIGLDIYEYVDRNKGTADEIYWWYVVRAVGVNKLEEDNEASKQEPGDGTPPSITLTSPNTYDVWSAYNLEDITWMTTEEDAPIEYINLYFSPDAGETWDIIEIGSPDSGTYTWSVPDIHTSEAMVRVRAVDTVGRWSEDVSTFNIIGSPVAAPGSLEVYLDAQGPSNWNYIYPGSYRGELDGAIGLTSVGVWYGGIRLELPEGRIQEIAYHNVQDSNSIRGLVYEDSGSEPGQLIGETDYYSELGEEVWYEWPLMEPVDIDEGYYWIVMEINDLGDGFFPFGVVDPDVNDGSWLSMDGEEWETLGDYDIDSSWMLEVLVQETIEGDDDNLVVWSASPDEATNDISHYNIYRSDDPGGPWGESTLIHSVDAIGVSTYQYYDLGRGTADEIYWWYVVRAVGLNGYEDQNEDAVQEPGAPMETFDITLDAGGPADGWNFVSFNLIPSDTTLQSILEDIDGNYDRVMYYDSSVDQWNSYMPGRAERYNNLERWNHRMGLWIRMTTTDTLTISGTPPSVTDINLNPGWNMVGLPSEVAGTHGIPPEVDRVGYFDASASSNIAYSYTPNTFTFEPGKGYLVHNPTEATLFWSVSYTQP